MTARQRQEKRERVERLKARVELDKKTIAQLEMEIRDDAYLERFEEMTKGPVPWKKLCWPSRSSPSFSGNGGVRDIYRCVACHERVGVEGHWSGAFIGGGFGQPPIMVHRRCIPQWVIEEDEKDLY